MKRTLLVLCLVGCLSATAQDTKRELNLGLEFGYVGSRLDGINKDYQALVDSNQFNRHSLAVPGLFFQLRPAKQHMSLMLGFQRASYTYESQTTYRRGIEINDHVLVSYDAYKIPVSIGFFLGPNEKISPFIRLGGVFNLITNKKHVREMEVMFSPPETRYDPAFTFINRPVSGTADLGVQIHLEKFIVVVKGRYERARAPFREYDARAAQTPILQHNFGAFVAVGYRFLSE